VHTEFWSGNRKGNHLEELSVGGKMILEWLLQNEGGPDACGSG